ncbi:hypothetical protein [Staphylococcus gallinarum]|uniref:hypothetical protein n=1 Tax=Staphylococcus gallinarum TaxID=1293 RepID=UPI001E507BF0|nr:hypothetical protein [Staphylococcus gallinarum]MCD8845201.1 hypothetical protein [Staphylococcus gallinarum]
MSKDFLIAAIDMVKGLSSGEREKLSEKSYEELEYIYNMIYLEKDEEMAEMAYIPISERRYKETCLFYRQ